MANDKPKPKRSGIENLAAALAKALTPKDTYPDKPRRIGVHELEDDK
ncbi:hypothetical protein AB0395_46200 [Streptosporangium sp. NPDC051023]